MERAVVAEDEAQRRVDDVQVDLLLHLRLHRPHRPVVALRRTAGEINGRGRIISIA